MPTTADYTTWPQEADILRRLATVAVTPRLEGDDLTTHIAEVREAVAKEVHRVTLRQFVKGAQEVRYYDGTGTPLLEVDEYVNFISATVIGLQAAPGYVLANCYEVKEQGKPKTRIELSRGSIPAWMSEGVIAPYVAIFPAGRQNIQINAEFGFADTIPADLWSDVCGEMAYRLAQEVVFRPVGRVSLQRSDTTEVRYELAEPIVTGWHERYLYAIRTKYKRPMGRRLRNLRNRMI